MIGVNVCGESYTEREKITLAQDLIYKFYECENKWGYLEGPRRNCVLDKVTYSTGSKAGENVSIYVGVVNTETGKKSALVFDIVPDKNGCVKEPALVIWENVGTALRNGGFNQLTTLIIPMMCREDS